MFKELPDILTVPEVAAALGVCTNTVYGLVHARQIGHKRIGKRIIVPKKCLEDYVLSARYSVDLISKS